MKKQLLLINLGLTVFTSSFASTPLFTALFSKMHKPSNVYIQQTQKIHEGHANFSGDWIGTCDYNPDEETAMKIEQSTDSSALKINNIEFPMDAISTSGSNVNSNIESTMVHLRWSEDGQQILVSTLAYYKPGNMALGDLTAGIASVNLSLLNGQLIQTTKLTIFTDGILDGKYPSNCVFNKS